MGRIANALTWFVMAVLLALVIAFWGVRVAGLTPYAVLSGSMEPLYPVGSLIYVAEVDPATVEPGESITFRRDSGQVATHQAYEVDLAAREIRTQGIANVNTDGTIMHDAEPVSFSQVIGVPVACIPLLGYVNAFVTTPPGSYIVIAGAIVLIALSLLLGSGSRGDAPVAGKHMRR